MARCVLPRARADRIHGLRNCVGRKSRARSFRASRVENVISLIRNRIIVE